MPADLEAIELRKKKRAAYMKIYQKRRYQEDPEFREKLKSKSKEYSKKVYTSDAEYRKKKIAATATRRQLKRALKQVGDTNE